MSNSLTPYQIEAQQKYDNLSNDQKESLIKLNELREKATGKQFAENDDTRFTKPDAVDAVAAAADDYLDDLIKKHQDQPAPLQTTQEFADAEQDESAMIPVRSAWRHQGELFKTRRNESIRKKKAAEAETFSNVVNLARKNPDVLEGIKSLTKRRGGKSRVFRKKSNKTKTKKVSRRNRRSRNIRRSRNSRAHERK